MPRKPLITERERTIIAMIYNINRESKAEVIRQKASEQCGRDIGLSTVQRELAKLRKDKNRGSTDPRDDQWSLASLKDYPISVAELPLLLYIQSTFQDNVPDIVNKIAKSKGHKPPFLTNRLAIWIGRLRILAESDPNLEKKLKPSSLITDKHNIWPQWVDDLVNIAMFYSNYEIGCELSGVKPINTVWFDAPNIDRIKYNIVMYQKDSTFITGLHDLSDQEIMEKFKNVDARSMIHKGGKNI
jgi:hypothetical protein